MKCSVIQVRLIAALVVFMGWSATAAHAGGILYNQSPQGPLATFSQIFPSNDFPAGSTLSFDDFVVPTPWLITGATAYGLEQANPALNQGVFFQIQSTPLPNFFDTTDPIHSGIEDSSGNLDFTGQSIVLSPGTYWITFWVERPVAGGNWLWYYSDVGNPIGSEFLIQNPGGQLEGNLYGYTNLVPGSTFFAPFAPPSDLAFTLYGQTIPEPSSGVLLGIGMFGIGSLAWRRRKKRRRKRAGG